MLSIMIILLLPLSTWAVSFNRYTQPPPTGILVAKTREELSNAVRAEYGRSTSLYVEDGGYYLKDNDTGERLVVAADSLVEELDQHIADIHARRVARNLDIPEVMSLKERDDVPHVGLTVAMFAWALLIFA
ncbi:hypothetical protein FE257_002514 [Aspergillus nanangensis]|uniref:Uncharacterized protein n=1 Tax=Aspergillus nanangensis TaxID=2582783 RepID=A0AAD4GY01_ASPNN|nr:hypothetical protein FE257_002514 [Aspergillus nanangensis]